jgi:DNA-binding response OmpR family regulator
MAPPRTSGPVKFRLEGEGYNVITTTDGEAAVETAVDAGFSLGADDYLMTLFSPQELRARVGAHLADGTAGPLGSRGGSPRRRRRRRPR